MNLTPRAKKALWLAEVDANNLGHSLVASQHLLLGLLRLDSGVHFNVMQSHGLTLEWVHENLSYLGPLAEPSRETAGFVLGESAAIALDRAAHEAACMSLTYTGMEHLLLGLLSETRGGAATLFAARKLDIASLRKQILNAYE